MADIISIANQKGGVGKTTVCRSLASLMNSDGKKVLCVDLDPQQNLSLNFGIVENRFDEDTPSIYHVLMDQVNIEQAIIQTPECDIIRSDYRLYRYTSSPLLTEEDFLRYQGDPQGMYQFVEESYRRQQSPKTDDRHKLCRALAKISDRYDYILIDNNPNLSDLFCESLFSSSHTKLLIPVFSEESSKESLIALNNTIETLLANDLSQKISIIGILISRYERNNVSKHYLSYLKKIAKTMGTELFETKLPKSVLVQESMAFKQSIFDQAKKAPIIDGYRAFYDEFKRRMAEIR